MAWIRRLRLFTLLILFAGVGLVVRIGNVADGVTGFSATALAQEQSNDAPAEPAADQSSGTEETAAQPAPSGDSQTEPGGIGNVDPLMMTRSELDLLQSLAERRAELDDRETQIELRERLLGATEKRIDGKIARLEAMEAKISEFVQLHEEQENEQLQSIVKVYETMKPKDAAVIFQRLEMSIQLELATRMREAKMAPILAAMDTDAARQLTTQLASRLELPDVEG